MASLPVVVINGLGAPTLAGMAYAAALRGRGFRTFTAEQRFFNVVPVEESAALVAQRVAAVLAQTSAPKVHLVGMSLGGLTGLYYLKCGGGGPYVDRFVSVGGPLLGTPIMASPVGGALQALPLPPHALAQTAPDSELMRAVHTAPFPSGVRMVSMGATGDVVTPRSSWDVAGMEAVESPYGVFPFGHWQLFLDPRNHALVADLLSRP